MRDRVSADERCVEVEQQVVQPSKSHETLSSHGDLGSSRAFAPPAQRSSTGVCCPRSDGWTAERPTRSAASALRYPETVRFCERIGHTTWGSTRTVEPSWAYRNGSSSASHGSPMSLAIASESEAPRPADRATAFRRRSSETITSPCGPMSARNSPRLGVALNRSPVRPGAASSVTSWRTGVNAASALARRAPVPTGPCHMISARREPGEIG